MLLMSSICFGQIAEDKQKHFVAGSVIGGVSILMMNKKVHNKKTKFWVAVGTSLVAGVLKETYDKNNGGKFDWEDVGYTVGGGIVGSFTINLFNK